MRGSEMAVTIRAKYVSSMLSMPILQLLSPGSPHREVGSRGFSLYAPHSANSAPPVGILSGSGLLSNCCQKGSEGARFELAVGRPTTVFKTVTLNHSDTPPGADKDRMP